MKMEMGKREFERGEKLGFDELRWTPLRIQNLSSCCETQIKLDVREDGA